MICELWTSLQSASVALILKSPELDTVLKCGLTFSTRDWLFFRREFGIINVSLDFIFKGSHILRLFHCLFHTLCNQILTISQFHIFLFCLTTAVLLIVLKLLLLKS